MRPSPSPTAVCPRHFKPPLSGGCALGCAGAGPALPASLRGCGGFAALPSLRSGGPRPVARGRCSPRLPRCGSGWRRRLGSVAPALRRRRAAALALGFARLRPRCVGARACSASPAALRFAFAPPGPPSPPRACGPGCGPCRGLALAPPTGGRWRRAGLCPAVAALAARRPPVWGSGAVGFPAVLMRPLRAVGLQSGRFAPWLRREGCALVAHAGRCAPAYPCIIGQ